MKVFLAKSAGFCMGVRRAVETTLEVIRKEDTGVSTFGPLIHNPQVLNLLEERGVRVLYAAEEADPTYLAELQEDYKAIQRGEVELSSSEEVMQELGDLGLNV